MLDMRAFFKSLLTLIMNFKYFVTLVGNFESTSIAPSPQQQLMETFEQTLIVAGPYTGSLQEIYSARSLALVFITGNLNHTLDVLLKTLEELKITSIICSGLTMALTIGLHKSDIVDVCRHIFGL